MKILASPDSIDELLIRCRAICGCSVVDLANYIGLPVPKNLKTAKGWVGRVIEYALGADCNNKAAPDFSKLGIELKTVPVNAKMRPLESTYVCTAPITKQLSKFENSVVWCKLAHVLWVPIVVTGNTIADRTVGMSLLWQPKASLKSILQSDWEDIQEYLACGLVDKLTARVGNYLHIRPKAASSAVLIPWLTLDGDYQYTTPKGFYIRTTLTKSILTGVA